MSRMEALYGIRAVYMYSTVMFNVYPGLNDKGGSVSIGS